MWGFWQTRRRLLQAWGRGRVLRATRTRTKNLVSQQAWTKSGIIEGVMNRKQFGPLQLRVMHGMWKEGELSVMRGHWLLFIRFYSAAFKHGGSKASLERIVVIWGQGRMEGMGEVPGRVWWLRAPESIPAWREVKAEGQRWFRGRLKNCLFHSCEDVRWNKNENYQCYMGLNAGTDQLSDFQLKAGLLILNFNIGKLAYSFLLV